MSKQLILSSCGGWQEEEQISLLQTNRTFEKKRSHDLTSSVAEYCCLALSGGLRATVPTCPCVSGPERSWNVVMTLHAQPVMLHWGAE